MLTVSLGLCTVPAVIIEFINCGSERIFQQKIYRQEQNPRVELKLQKRTQEHEDRKSSAMAVVRLANASISFYKPAWIHCEGGVPLRTCCSCGLAYKSRSCKLFLFWHILLPHWGYHLSHTNLNHKINDAATADLSKNLSTGIYHGAQAQSLPAMSELRNRKWPRVSPSTMAINTPPLNDMDASMSKYLIPTMTPNIKDSNALLEKLPWTAPLWWELLKPPSSSVGFNPNTNLDLTNDKNSCSMAKRITISKETANHPHDCTRQK